MLETINFTDELYSYYQQVGFRDEAILRKLREETAGMPGAIMQISPEQGQFMSMLVQMIGAKRAIDIGVFTGYSALVVAMALPDDGEVVACDVCEKSTAVAQRYWQEAGVDSKVSLKIAPAADTLQALLDDGQAGTFDFIFIDADKRGYDSYYELSLQLLSPTGLILFDNMLQNGRVSDVDCDNKSVVAIRALNQKLHSDSRVSICMVPMSDGVTMVQKV